MCFGKTIRRNFCCKYLLASLSQTVKRALPRFLRVLTTLLPVCDLILTLNPETLFLFLLVPPKVLFVIFIYSRIGLDLKFNLSVHCTSMFQVPKYVEMSISPTF